MLDVTMRETPYAVTGLSPEQIGSMRAQELRAIIRQNEIHKSFGIGGMTVSGMTTKECRDLLLTGKKPEKAVSAIVEDGSPRTTGKSTAALGMLGEAIVSDVMERVATLLDQHTGGRSIIEVRAAGKVTEIHGAQHFKFPLVLACLGVPEINIALVGPAGSGKSRLVFESAKALGLECSPVSFNILSSKSDVLGMVDAHGVYHASAFRERFEHGGVFLADEFDACHPGIGTILNAAIANRVCTFADNKTITAHPDFRAVVAMNTFGLGATAEYCGRNRLDAATLDRFAFIELPYDDFLECSILGLKARPIVFDIAEGGIPSTEEWVNVVKSCRRTMDKLKIKAIVSPRASIYGSMLASAGIGRKHLMTMFLLKGLNETDIQRIHAELN